MKTNRKWISGILGIAIMAGVGSESVAAANTDFNDVRESHWAHGAIENLEDRQILAGYPDGTFKPNDYVTRAEAAKIIANTAGISPAVTSRATYADVPSSHWASGYIEALSQAGVVHGQGNGKFGINDLLTRAEMAKILTESFDYTSTSQNAFSDVSPSYWAFDYIMALHDNNITVGFPKDNTYRPNDEVTRAQMAVFASRTLNGGPDQQETPAPTPAPARDTNDTDTSDDPLDHVVDDSRETLKPGREIGK